MEPANRPSTANDLARLVADTLRLNQSLLQTITSVPSHGHTLELETQLKAFDTVLGKLQQILVNTDADLTALKLPIQTCFNTCGELQRKISQKGSLSCHLILLIAFRFVMRAIPYLLRESASWLAHSPFFRVYQTILITCLQFVSRRA
jgi:Fungal N-terminal domain of STAND proteins